MIERGRERGSVREREREREADIGTERETEIGRDNESEKNLEMRVEFEMANVLMKVLRTKG